VVVISFEDTGQGIEKQDLARIFDFYYSTKTGGTGLGLAIVQQIIEEHQGVVNVKSKIDEGTVFSIVLPKHFAQEVHA
jgi:signal transduction histidine kinase